jgi:hypothetical protein
MLIVCVDSLGRTVWSPWYDRESGFATDIFYMWGCIVVKAEVAEGRWKVDNRDGRSIKSV